MRAAAYKALESTRRAAMLAQIRRKRGCDCVKGARRDRKKGRALKATTYGSSEDGPYTSTTCSGVYSYGFTWHGFIL